MVNKRKDLIKKIFAKVAIYFVLLLMYAPLIYITVFSFTKVATTGVWNGFNLGNYSDLFNAKNKTAQAIWKAAGNTMLVAIVAGLISTVLGTLGAIGIHNIRNRHLKSSLNFVTQIPIVNAEIVTAVSLLVLFAFFKNTFGINKNFMTLVIGHVVLTLPYVVISVIPKLEQMDPSLYEAALDLGATRTQALWKVIIPEIVPGILTGFMLSVTLSLDDFVITEFTKPESGNFETISIYVDNQLSKSGIPQQMRAFTAILFAVILIVMVGMFVKTRIDNNRLKASSYKGD